MNALAPYDAWISGIRRDQSPSRADTPKVQWSSATACSRSTPSPTGTRSRSGPTSASTTSLQPLRRRVPFDRLYPLHSSNESKMRSGLGAGRDRTSSNAAYTKERHWKGQHEPLAQLASAHERSHTPRSRSRNTSARGWRSGRCSRSGSPGSRVLGRRRSHITSDPRWTDEDSSSSTSTETRSARISRRGSGSRRRTATPTWNARLGRLARHAPRRGGHRGRDLTLRAGAP